MKRIKVLLPLLALCLCVALVSGCGSGQGAEPESLGGKTYRIVCTIFPEYDWVRQILDGREEQFGLTMLLDNGTDLHSYQPSAADIAMISECDLFIYVGGESDSWVEDALTESVNKDMQVIRLLDVLGSAAKVEELVEGMETEDGMNLLVEGMDAADGPDQDDAGVTERVDDRQEADEAGEPKRTDDRKEAHDAGEPKRADDRQDVEDAGNLKKADDRQVADDAGGAERVDDRQEVDDADEAGEPEYDEHVWLSLSNARLCAEEITEALKRLDSSDADVFQANYDAYRERLDALDQQYRMEVPEGVSVVFGDRFPFRYLVDDYGIRYYAAFAGCSAETEASFETIVFLAEKLDELDLGAIFTIDGSDQRIARAIVSNTARKDQEILTLDSMQSVTQADAAAGTTYLGIMESNLEILRSSWQLR